MSINSDWHIHSRNSCDGACMEVFELIRKAEEKGIRDFGLTDHIHTPFNLPDLAKSREEYLACEPEPNFHFGVELSCVSRWELDEVAKGNYDQPPVYGLRSGGPAWAEPALGATKEDLVAQGVEYVVAGVHWPLYVPFERESIIRDYHRQNMFLARDPLVDIVAHPWWWMGHWRDDDGNYCGDPWLDDFKKIPASMHDEFATALLENEKAAEVNLQAMLLTPLYPERFKQQYLEYLAELDGRGVRLTIGSDCHSAHYEVDFEKAGEMLASVGIKPNRLSRPF